MKTGPMRQNNSRFFWLCAAVLWACFIWSNSLKTAAASGADSSRVMELLNPVFDCLNLSDGVRSYVTRKLAHFTEFAVLGLLWSLTLIRPPRRTGSAAGLALAFCVWTAACDEIIQLSVPGRAGKLTDVLIDSSGACLSVLICLLAVLIIRRVKQRKLS